jgi:N-acetylmuramoyl-L-alanine amidase
LRRRGRDRLSLVDESKRAWHAGKSRWRGVTDVNSASVGIEIVNPGTSSAIGRSRRADRRADPARCRHQGTPRRSAAAMSSAIRTSRPARKEDPGELFPWEALAKRRLALAEPDARPHRSVTGPTRASCWRSSASATTDRTRRKAVIAFQRRFRPDLIDGIIDGECRAKLLAALPRPQ